MATDDIPIDWSIEDLSGSNPSQFANLSARIIKLSDLSFGKNSIDIIAVRSDIVNFEIDRRFAPRREIKKIFLRRIEDRLK
jgi:hypothetical protein